VLLLVVAASRVLAAESARLEGGALATAEEEARGALAPLAEGAPAFEGRQAFTVTEGGARMRILPVRFTPRPPVELANVDHCALLILDAGVPVEAIRTVGTGYTESLGCTGLDAIGFPDLDGDGRFEIALIYSTLAPPDRARKTPVVVRRQGTGRFAVDESLTAALDAAGGITTIGALRRAAAKRGPAPPK
jgi:hypothetical protein